MPTLDNDRFMPDLDMGLFHNILSIQSHSRQTDRMTRFIVRHLKRRGVKVMVENGNVYGVKGDAAVYPCMVAHTDTVHNIVDRKEYKVLRQDDFLFAWNPVKNAFTGVGGDDKVGIFLALSALARYDNFKVAFFRDEEIGCVGSGVANMEFFKDCAFILQGDRRGNDDFVNSIYSSSLYSRDFKEAIAPTLKQYGYAETTGALTDVYELTTKGVGLCVANFSCGYWNPHSAKEFIDVNDVRNTLGMVMTIIDNLGDRQWPHTSVKSYSSYNNKSYNSRKYTYSGYNRDDEYGWDDDGYFSQRGYGTHSQLADVGKWTGRTKQTGITFPEDGAFGEAKLTADGCCPYCNLDDQVNVDPYIDQWYCERCYEYLGTAMGF